METWSREVADLLVTDILEALVMPSLANTDIGKATGRNTILTANSTQNLSDAALPSLTTSLLKQQEVRNIEYTNDTATSNLVTSEESVESVFSWLQHHRNHFSLLQLVILKSNKLNFFHLFFFTLIYYV
jgi:hypothetical protein